MKHWHYSNILLEIKSSLTRNFAHSCLDFPWHREYGLFRNLLASITGYWKGNPFATNYCVQQGTMTFLTMSVAAESPFSGMSLLVSL